MIAPTRTARHARLLFTGFVAALALLASAAMTQPAKARVFVSIGVPCCGYFPGPYYGYYPPPPYYYAPPPGYYPPPPGSYPPAGSYPPSATGPTAYAPSAAPSATPATPMPSAAVPASPQITYTSKPAFTNSAGQTCREYKTMEGGRDVYGTACKTADGQWRVVN